MSSRTKIMLAIMLAVTLSIAGVSVMVSIEMRSAFVENFRINSKAQLERMESFVDAFFDNAIANAELLADSPLVREQLDSLTSYAHTTSPYKPIGEKLPEGERSLYSELLRLTKAFPAYILTYVGSSRGGFTQAPDDTLSAGYNPVGRPWYIDTVKAGKGLVTEAYLSDNGDAVCTVASPILTGKHGDYAGVVGFDILLETLTRETGGVKVGKTGYVLMIDAAGQVISDPRYSGPSIPEADRWLGKVIARLPKDASESMAKLSAMKEGVTEVTFDGKDWLAGVQIAKNNWLLVMLQEKNEVFANAMEVTLGILIVGLVLMAVMGGVAWIVARSISGPVAILANASQTVAGGDLNAIPTDERPFKGELGVLHRSLKRMVAKLAELIDVANSKITEAECALAASKESLQAAEEAKKEAENARREGVHHTAEQIGGILGQLSAATERLAREAGQMEKRAEDQQGLVIGTASAIGQMNTVVEEVAASTSRTAHLAEEAQNEARNGRGLVMDVVSNMGGIEQQSLAMRNSLESLGSQASDIGQIMGVINDIADQTNLLALNAAIEAARAGEAGRGFAVVADEVRKLAEKTMEATKQVGGAITAIQNGTRQNMEAMQEAVAFVSTSTEVANKAGAALASIQDMVEKTAGEVRSIATASEEQSATTAEINSSTATIKAITDEVALSSQRSNEAVTELVDLSHKLTDIVEALRKE